MKPFQLLGALVLLALALPAGAGDGRIEISQALVEAAGGFPFMISEPGSYVLTSALTVPDLVTTAIEVRADGLVIDLNGFAIRGPNVCESGNCSSAAGWGVVRGTLGVGGNRVTVKNGSLSGLGGSCIILGTEAHVEGLTVSHCGGNGIHVGDHSIVRANRVVSVGQRGISMGSDAAYADNVVVVTGLRGIPTFTAAVVGGRPTGGNVCDDGSCGSDSSRRYYLTEASFRGSEAAAPENCADGFHFASLWEIFDTTDLRYDLALGQTTDDMGLGPPAGFQAWVRTGANSFGGNLQAGRANCRAWSSANDSDRGSAAVLGFNIGAVGGLSIGSWNNPPDSAVLPWIGGWLSCQNSRPIWCVED